MFPLHVVLGDVQFEYLRDEELLAANLLRAQTLLFIYAFLTFNAMQSGSGNGNGYSSMHVHCTERFISYRKYILQITQPSQYRCTQLQYRFAVITEAPSMLAQALVTSARLQMLSERGKGAPYSPPSSYLFFYLSSVSPYIQWTVVCGVERL